VGGPGARQARQAAQAGDHDTRQEQTGEGQRWLLRSWP
jgi:hypothetical protein